MVKWTGEMVRKFVESEGYELVSVPNWDWVKSLDKIVVTCGSHEPYEVRWGNFQQSKRCAKCANKRRNESSKFSHEEVCKKINELDKNYFVCSDSLKYENNKTKLKLSCGKHEFMMCWNHFSIGNRCPKCMKSYRYSHDEICEEINKLESNYYVFNDSPKYENSRTKLRLSCGKHEFMMCWADFNSGYRCPKCGALKVSEKLSYSHEYIIEKIQDLDEDYFICHDSPKYENNKTKLKLFHSVCKNEFYITWNMFKRGSRNCGCYSNSKNEILIKDYLKEINIEFKKQVTFDNLVSDKGNKLRYDFGIYREDKLLFLLEYDGEQHFEAKTFGGISKEQANRNLIKTQYHDKLKNDYAKENNIPLLRIRYDEDTIFVLENYLKGLQLIEEDDIINLTKKE